MIGTNCGHVVNPDQVRAQIEGSVAYGLGALLHQENTVKDGADGARRTSTRFPSLLMDEMPQIEIGAGADLRLLGRRRRADHHGRPRPPC